LSTVHADLSLNYELCDTDGSVLYVTDNDEPCTEHSQTCHMQDSHSVLSK